jgi:hypothetical protein
MFSATPGPYRLVAGTGASSVALDVTGPNGDAPVALALEGAAAPPPSLDLAFLVDTTGSMGDELSYIQSELLDVIARVRAASSNEIDLRLSVDFYRDIGDDYVVRSYPFTADVQVAVDALRLQSANGGGDTPESMDRALEVAVEQLEWRSSATARVLFLVCDAPPHAEPDVVARVRTQVRAAAEKGIRIIPVSGSGIDKETEFLLRFIDIATAGTYAFLTDDSGIGGAHLDPHPTIGPYTVEFLNDLMVRLVRARLGG